jgi:hypothetical protein
MILFSCMHYNMDPIVITSIALLTGYAWWKNSGSNNSTKIKTYIDPSKYHELCRKYSLQKTLFDTFTKKFKNKMKYSFVLSEVSFNQLVLFNKSDNQEKEEKESKSETQQDSDSDDNSNNDEISFYQTLNNYIIDSHSKIESCIWIEKNIKFNPSDDIKKIYDVKKINMTKFPKYWSTYGEDSKININGNTILANKFMINEIIVKSVIDDDENILIYEGISTGKNIIKIDINNKYALLIMPLTSSLNKSSIFKQMKSLIPTKTKTLIILPEFDVGTSMDFKQIPLLYSNMTEFNKHTTTSNVISIVSLQLNGKEKKKIKKKEYKIHKYTNFNFALLHLPSQQILMIGQLISEREIISNTDAVQSNIPDNKVPDNNISK